ncbi:type II toxin-antitoxin system VapC family toxin [Cyanobium sp. N5-Cardenillas]|uniref:type II toxin-antitoxin system VapC family toxin n=1 Tax=Cyanobium sp. N5-Cardenillas TaxID=2823720 RepID=UPI0020CD91A2|nr:type II toxin-antitoxin system VapC family toxin [Cyanobium sp. N5-Cardenillas]MCP9785157.1 type II toxin-antitoxin system VapC family toxin [Cyanobium sp. N5-Cardenillas]
MVIDSSAILAILQNEPERRSFNQAIQSAALRRLSAASLLELSIVLEARFGPDGQGDLDVFLAAAEIEVVSFDRNQAELARLAFRRFGKGRHRAGLNLGDCFSYALAKSLAAPLLYKGDDFIHTDLASAIEAGR